MSDVPLGVFLSGGLDSSALAGADVAAWSRSPIRTFSVGFADADANELAVRAAGGARRAAPSTARWWSRPSEFFDALPRLVWHEDEPIAFTSSVPLYFVSRLAAEHVKVVLTGEGADELFLGYNRYRITLWNERLGGTYRALVPASLRGADRRGPAPPAASARALRDADLPGARARIRASSSARTSRSFPTALQRDLLADPTCSTRAIPTHDGARALRGGAGRRRSTG